jgi:hypothetical protein
MDRERLVRPEGDRARVPTEGYFVLELEPLDERDGVDEIGSFVQLAKIPENVQSPTHPEHVAPGPESAERTFDTIRPIVESRRQLPGGGSNRSGLTEGMAQLLAEFRTGRLRHDAARTGSG